MKIQLSEHFGFKKLLRFVLPSIIMMIFTSIYGVIDGFFVSNYVGKTSFAALNLIMPALMIFGAVGFMIGTGGSAIVSVMLGAKLPQKANSCFSMLVYATVAAGLFFTLAGQLFLENIAVWMGAKGEMLEFCVLYGRIILVSLTAYMLQNVFQSFLVAAEKPKLGLMITIMTGVANILLDFVFVAVFQWGLAGAAIATAISQFIGGIVPLIYFLRPNASLLKLIKTSFDAKILLKACTNGSSELMTNISLSLVNMLYNFQLMKFMGENGVAAYGVIMYVSFVFVAAFIGYSIGVAPIIGYHYGAQSPNELKNLFKKSIIIISSFSVLMILMSEILSVPIAKIFVGYDESLYGITLYGFRIYALSFLLSGINIFASAFFTALNNGIISAALSFTRTLLFQVAAILILPVIMESDGIWFSVIAAEAFALVLTIVFFVSMKKKYKY